MMMQCNSTDLPNEQTPEPATRPQRVGLLEDWPHHSSSLEAEDAAPNLAPPAAVTFSAFSTLRVYDDSNDHYRNTKAYTKKDYEVFGAQAMKEAHRIRKLIHRSPPTSVKESVKYVLRNSIVTTEELVGIDHLVLGKRCSGVMKVRRDHMKAVLWKQLEQRRRREHQQPQEVEEDSLIDLLGKCAEQSSLKSTQAAIARATLSFSQ